MPGNESKLFVVLRIFYHIRNSDRDCHRFFYFSEKQRENIVYIVENIQIHSPDSVSAMERDALSGFPSVPLSQVLPLYRQPP